MSIEELMENARLKGRVIALEAEVQTLTAEVRCLEAVIRSHERVDSLIVANLKAELERLTIERNGFEQAMKANQSILETKRDENERLRNLAIKLDGYVDLVRHDNARLRKAGDAMVEHIRLGEEVCFETLDGDEVVQAWNAAKEGKQS